MRNPDSSGFLNSVIALHQCPRLWSRTSQPYVISSSRPHTLCPQVDRSPSHIFGLHYG